MTVAAWVRQALRAASRRQARGSEAKKLEAIRAAAGHAFPAGTIEQMLAELTAGTQIDGMIDRLS